MCVRVSVTECVCVCVCLCVHTFKGTSTLPGALRKKKVSAKGFCRAVQLHFLSIFILILISPAMVVFIDFHY